MEKALREQPDYAEALSVLAMNDAALGRKEDALKEGHRAAELLPTTKDAMTGAEVLRNLAITYAWAGEKELALKQLRRAPAALCPDFLWPTQTSPVVGSTARRSAV